MFHLLNNKTLNKKACISLMQNTAYPFMTYPAIILFPILTLLPRSSNESFSTALSLTSQLFHLFLLYSLFAKTSLHTICPSSHPKYQQGVHICKFKHPQITLFKFLFCETYNIIIKLMYLKNFSITKNAPLSPLHPSYKHRKQRSKEEDKLETANTPDVYMLFLLLRYFLICQKFL